MTDSVASPALSEAVRRALAELAVQWPRPMAPAMSTSEDGRQFLEQFCSAMRGADLRAIPLAAREWIATERFAPKPAELGELARELSQLHFPAVGVAAVSSNLFDGARWMWFERDTPDGPVTCYAQVLSGKRGTVGISEAEMDDLYAGRRKWGWHTGERGTASGAVA